MIPIDATPGLSAESGMGDITDSDYCMDQSRIRTLQIELANSLSRAESAEKEIEGLMNQKLALLQRAEAAESELKRLLDIVSEEDAESISRVLGSDRPVCVSPACDKPNPQPPYGEGH